MALKAGIVGLPNVGKSTLFNAITKQDILAENYPFATIEPNLGTVFVDDERMETLDGIYLPKRLIYTSYEFIDIAGLVEGASKGEGLGNKFLSHIREVDAICEVVRCFEDDKIIHVDNTVDPIRDIEIIGLELALADLEAINSRISRMEKKVKTEKNKDDILEFETLKKCKTALEDNKAIRTLDLNDDEIKSIKSFNFLTQKPIIYLANIKEDDIGKDTEMIKKVREYAKDEGSKVVEVCVKLEEDLKDMDKEERKELLDSFGLKSSALEDLIIATYDLLGLETFFTAGEDEVRAWTFKKGMTAKECAGIIHTDFERGFIRAEVISYKDLIEYGSELKVREHGKLRIEGKDYLMQDGDIVFFRFNV